MKKAIFLIPLALLILNCCKKDPTPTPDNPKGYVYVVPSPKTYDGVKQADISYQLLVYSFADKNGDKWGDFGGIIDKLDYLDSLGVSAVWLSPIHPAMDYHGYDVLDYSSVNTTYGDMSSFEELVRQAHSHNIKIYIDYVLNHTGARHPWFLDASSSPESDKRDYYIFSTDPKSDIATGKIAMIATEGAGGYDEGQWFSISSSTNDTLLFSLNWSNSASPSITVTSSSTVDVDNPDVSATNAKYVYFGDGSCKKMYSSGNNQYYLNVDFSSNWGFLIRTSNTLWDNKTKYGAKSLQEAVITLGQPFTLYTDDASSNVQNILFPGSAMYHSHFWTSYFADLNYGSAATCETSAPFQELVKIGKMWVDKGIDGMRLDAVKHIYHNESSSENPTFLNKFYGALNTYFKASYSKDFYMVGEVFSAYDKAAPYYRGLPALFDFSYWWTLKESINNGKGNAFMETILSYRELYVSYSANFIQATKLSNHDEVRACTDFSGSTAKAKLAGAVLLTSGGSPYIYYGEELGYIGNKDKGDEYVRAPMLWGDGYTTSYTDKIDPSLSQKVGTVISQSSDTASVLKVYKDFARVRNQYSALAKGTMTKYSVYDKTNTQYPSVAAWMMVYGDEKALVLHNFGPEVISLPIINSSIHPIARQGNVYLNKDSSPYMVRMEGYSSVVFEITQ